MSQQDWNEAKERVRQAVDIVELIGDHLQLRREGRGYKALCPWHDDSRPSLQVNPERQSFKCWVCDIGGDIFSFVMKIEGVDFPEALRMLADRAGIKLEPRRGERTDGFSGEVKRDVYQTLAWAEQRFHAYLLQAAEAEPARSYLAERGITLDSIAKFRLGYSPNRWDWLVNEARSTEYNPKLLTSAGLVAERNNGPGVYDRFRGRVLFSIHDPLGKTVGFGGRVLPGISDDSPAKYVNSPETPVFQKSGLLYALDHAKDAIQKSGTAVVMEGYTDVIIAHQCGFTNAVACLGTALGERHIRLLRRFADRIVLLLDGDEAGRKRTDEILELFIAEQVDLRILTLPDELDPADFLLAHGADELRALLRTTVDALDHKYRSLVERLGRQPSTHEVNAAVESVLAILAKAPGRVDEVETGARLREDQMLVRLAQLSGLDEERLRKRLAGLRKNAARPALANAADSPEPETAPIAGDEPRFARAERWLMEILIHAPEMLAEVRPLLRPDDLRSAVHRTVYARACMLADAGRLPDYDVLMLEFDDPQIKTLLISLDEDRRGKNRTATLDEVRDLVRALHERKNEESAARHGALPSLESTASGKDEELERLRSAVRRQRERQGISLPTEG